MRNMFVCLCLLLGLVGLAGCGGSDSGPTDAGSDDFGRDAFVPMDGEAPMDGEVLPDAMVDGEVPTDDTIYSVRNPSFPVGDAVLLEGVVVIAVDTYGTLSNRVFVQEPAGGPFGSVVVMANATSVASLAPGDVVTISGGIKEEYAAPFDTSGRTATRIVAPVDGAITIAETGTTTVPAPTLVDAFVIAASPAEAEQWESSLVRVENVRTRDVPTVPGADPLFKNVTLTGQLRATSQFTELGTGGTDFPVGTCFASMTGVLEYFGFVSNLAPRSPSDITNGTACPTHTNIVNIQNGTVPTATVVALTDVVVTAVDADPLFPRVWVADAAQGALFNGILVYNPTVAIGTVADLAVGDIVRVVGITEEFMTLTELVGVRVIPTTLPSVTPVPLSVSIASLAGDNGDPEPYESVLVTLSAPAMVTTLNPDGASDFGDYMVGSSPSYRVDESVFDTRPPRTIGECLTTVRGVVGFVAGSGRISPRSASDVVAGDIALCL